MFLFYLVKCNNHSWRVLEVGTKKFQERLLEQVGVLEVPRRSHVAIHEGRKVILQQMISSGFCMHI